MKSSDLRLRGQGIGSVHQFVCGVCNAQRPTLGRKRTRWKGMETYACAACHAASLARKIAAKESAQTQTVS